MDAEYVETRASSAPAAPSHNSQVYAQIGSLKPEITDAEAAVRAAQARVNQQTELVERLASAAAPGFLASLGMASRAEKARLEAGKTQLERERRTLASLAAELATAGKAVADLKEQRRRLYNSYEGRPRRRRFR